MFQKVKEFFGDIKKVIREITWPDKETLIQLTVVVIFISAITAVFLGGADFLFTKLITIITFK